MDLVPLAGDGGGNEPPLSGTPVGQFPEVAIRHDFWKSTKFREEPFKATFLTFIEEADLELLASLCSLIPRSVVFADAFAAEHAGNPVNFLTAGVSEFGYFEG